MTGGDLRLVDGLISDAGALIGAAVRASDDDWFEVATLKEPYRIEGKKTMGLEIAEQLGWRMPDAILYPTGGGVGLIGIHKALLEARELGWLEGDLPRLVSVQATGCAPIVTAFEAGAAESVKVENSSTVAFGINVPKALGDFLILAGGPGHGRDGGGGRRRRPARRPGPGRTAGGHVPLPGGRGDRHGGPARWSSPGSLGADDEVVLLNTGAGVIYPDTVTVDVPTIAKDGVLRL